MRLITAMRIALIIILLTVAARFPLMMFRIIE